MIIVRLFLLALIGSALPLEGTGIPLLPLQQVEADHVDLEDKTLHLVGHVNVIHEMGAITCDESTMLMPQEKKEGEAVAVSTILLKGNVVISFTDGSQLLSDEGLIDCQTLEGTFTAIPPAKVTYTSFATDGRLRIPVRATGKALKAKIIKTDLGYSLASMRGEGAVNIEYQRPLPPDTAADDVPVGERESKEEDANDE